MYPRAETIWICGRYRNKKVANAKNILISSYTIIYINIGKVEKQKHTAGEDQLPQESANVTNGSDHSRPKMLLAFTSSFLAAFGHVCGRESR